MTWHIGTVLKSIITSNKHSNKQCDIQFMSDLHLERIAYEFDVPKSAPCLALAGDIGRLQDFEAYAAFIRKQCDRFDRVLLVAGNHEFYGSSHEEGLSVAKKLVDDPSLDGKLTFMNRTRVDMDESNVIVLGCTLHSYIGPDHTKLTNDFRRIRDWTVEKHNTEHKLDVEWLQRCLQDIADTEPQKKVVIMTHYAPSFEGTCHPEQENNAVSSCFCSHTLEVFRDWKGAEQVTHWIFGHTHWNTRFKCRGTIVLSNQLCNDVRNLSWWQKYRLYRPFDNRAMIHI